MPSDCQCSTCIETRTIIKEKVLNNKQATKKIELLKEEVEKLKSSNKSLKRRLHRAATNKETIVKDLKSKLDNM